jgi:hypothetical protein
LAALKIPRLLADTHRENAFIAALLANEEDGAQKANKGEAFGLIPTLGAAYHMLQPPRHLGLRPETASQNGNLIVVRFQKGTKPQLFGIRYEKVNNVDQLIAVPSGAAEQLRTVFTQEVWAKLEASSQTEKGKWQRACVVSQRGAEIRPDVQPLTDTLTPEPTSAAYFVVVPSVVYKWANGTLQEAMSETKMKSWGFREHLKLLGRVLEGLETLHQRKMLHADLRPANIMYIGRADVPEHYAVSDYASLAERSIMRTAADNGNTGQTVVGQLISAARVTAFYAPERVAGLELETADMAIVKKLSNNKNGSKQIEYVIQLGWRKDLLEKSNKEVKKNVLAGIDSWYKNASSGPPLSEHEDHLIKGDRLWVRDYIFDILDSGKTQEGAWLYRCQMPYAKVMHDRLTVYVGEEDIGDMKVIDLARYTELRQWSAASDLYSVGVLALYTLYYGGSTPGSDTSVDKEFQDMLKDLASRPCFHLYWSEVVRFQETLEAYFFANRAGNPADALKVLTSVGNELQTEAVNLAGNIVLTIPGTGVLLERLGYNLAWFIFFIHFVFACLHRRSDLPEELRKDRVSRREENAEARGGTGGLNPRHFPFCRDRTEQPGPDGAATWAKDRVKTIEEEFAPHPIFAIFSTLQLEGGTKFDWRSDVEVRRRKLELDKEMARVEEAKRIAEGATRAAEEAKDKAEAAVTALGEKIAAWKELAGGAPRWYDYVNPRRVLRWIRLGGVVAEPIVAEGLLKLPTGKTVKAADEKSEKAPGPGEEWSRSDTGNKSTTKDGTGQPL